jgi:hypothetical protein
MTDDAEWMCEKLGARFDPENDEQASISTTTGLLVVKMAGMLGRRSLTTVVSLVGVACCAFLTAEEPSAAGLKLFRERIEPVLIERCYTCHSGEAKEVQGGLRLDSREAIQKGGDSGAAITPGKPSDSLLLKALRHEEGYAMPPKQPKLPAALIADFEKWIELGAPDPRDGKLSDQDEWPPEARAHWAFQPVRRPLPVAITDRSWPRTAVDTFVLQRLEERQWQPARAARTGDLLRRVTFDLTGLPPTPEAIKAFEDDTSPDAYERLVDRLLASPQFGEKAAQAWLDVVRYAETEGYEYDRHVPDAWRYRDYVINSFNSDKPYDQFLREQIAGDEFSPQDHEALTATIFFRLGPVRRNAGNPDIALSRNEVLTERTDIIGSAVLGLTVGCARCHNHKLEPISQRDYYCLQAYLAATDEHNILLAAPAEQERWETETKRIKEQMQRIHKIARLKTGEERIRLQAQVDALEDQLPSPLATIPSTWNDFPKRTPIHVLRRGEWEKKGAAVGPRPLSVLVSKNVGELPADVSNPRTQLAEWLTRPDHPLTARVIANRVWQQHFGSGIVKTANDFGLHGEAPSHPELLDWLAASLVENHWRLKPLHRTLVLSAAYRQASDGASESVVEADPENRLLARFSRRRLSAEELRDAMLLTAGRLNLKAGGASVMPPVDEELVKQLYKPAQWQPPQVASEADRRSIYLIAKRNLRLPFMEVFDGPALLTSCARREASTHAPQALELLNGALSNELAVAFAERLQAECGGNREQIVTRAFWLGLGREPNVAERTASLAFLETSPLREFALAIFNLNDFAYVP